MSYLWRILTAMRMTIKEFFSFKTNKYFWVNIIAMIVVMVVMIFGVLKWLDIHTHHGESVVVPDVKGMTVEEATKMFRNHGLVYVISDTKYVKDKAAGIILELKPGAGEKVKEGRTLAAGEKIPLGASLTLMVGDGSGDMSEEEDSVDVSVDTEKPVTSESSPAQDDSWF